MAVRLADLFHRRMRGSPLPAEAVAKGSACIQWPGRLEEVRAAGAGNVRVFLDGAHNDYSVRRVLEEVAAGLPKRQPVAVLFGCAKDKDADSMLRVLAESRAAVVFTHSGNARGVAAEDLAAAWKNLTGRDAPAFSDCNDALRAALALAAPNGVVIAAGSLYLVGALKDRL